MGTNGDLILTGWGYTEYVIAAAVALKALGGEAEVYGVSRRRLPELLTELAMEDGAVRWARLYILGVALDGDPEALAAALGKLKARRVKVVWLSAMEMPGEVARRLEGKLETHVLTTTLHEAVGRFFGVDVRPYHALLEPPEHASAETRALLSLIAAARFHYRNYQDLSLYATAARYLANGVKACAWEPTAKAAVAHYNRYGERELLGASPVITTLRQRIRRVAAHDHARVLILGESGTGKETIAQLIHTQSPRREMPFISFNCASVATELLEDRFFGHEKGAFTNAITRTDGLFLMADGGTLFLDEIGEMPPEAQALLLRVLEGGRFMRVGGREELRCDVRLVTATNRNLPELVRQGRFRGDLYQRLNVVQLRAPALREHKRDIPCIANAWWRKFHSNRVLGEGQLTALMDYDYPGNVRELINFLDRATALEEGDFGLLMREHKEMNAGLGAPQGAPAEEPPDELEAATRHHIRRVCEKYGQNLTRAAKALGVSRTTVRKYL